MDTDGTVSAPEFADVILTSVEKAMDVAVFEAIRDSMDGSLDPTEYVGTLENGGVNIAPFHDFADKVDSGLQAELDAIAADIISGAITVSSPSSPR